MNYIEEQTDEEGMNNSIKNGDQPLPRVTQVSLAGTTSTEQPPLNDKSIWSDQEKRIQNIDHLERSLLIQGLPNDIYSLIDSNKTAKDLWDALLENRFEPSSLDRFELAARSVTAARLDRFTSNLLDRLPSQRLDRSRTDPTLLNNFEIVAKGNGDLSVPGLQTMKELCQASLNATIGNTQNVYAAEAYQGNGDPPVPDLRTMKELCQPSLNDREINKNLMKVLQINQQVKAVTPNCETCGGPHSYNDCPVTIGQTQNVYSVGAYQGGNSYQPQGSRTLPSNTITNSKEDLKGITTQSGNAYQGTTILTTSSSSPQVVERETESLLAVKESKADEPKLGNPGLGKPVLDKLERVRTMTSSLEELVSSLVVPLRNTMIVSLIPILILKVLILIVSVFVLIKPWWSEIIVRTIAKHITVTLSATISGLEEEMIELDDLLRLTEERDIDEGHHRNSDFLLEEVDAFLALEDDPTSPEVDQSYVNTEGDILLLEAFVNDDPLLPPPSQGNYLPQVRKKLKICEAKSDKSSIDEPPKVELKDLPPHLKYEFLEGDDKLPVIIAKDLSMEEKTTLITRNHRGNNSTDFLLISRAFDP
nr:reverse transcriptase domain-containing protein [Tanacetum cinerariifolium]